MDLLRRIHALFMGRYLQDALEAGIKEYRDVPIAEHLESTWKITEQEYRSHNIECFTIFDNNFLLGVVFYLREDDNIYIKHFLWSGNFHAAERVYNSFKAFLRDNHPYTLYMRCNKDINMYTVLGHALGMEKIDAPETFPWGLAEESDYFSTTV